MGLLAFWARGVVEASKRVVPFPRLESWIVPPLCGLCGELASPRQRIRALVTVLPIATGPLRSLMFGL